MAGNYPDVPSWRIPYHTDGSVLLSISATNVVTQLTAADLEKMNDEADGTGTRATIPTAGSAYGKLCVVFPRLMDLAGLFATVYLQSITGWEYSTNTTNGIDGTWTSFSPSMQDYTYEGPTAPAYRSSIWSGSLSGVRAVRVLNSNNSDSWISTLHLFGAPSTGEDLNRLEFWHPTLDQRLGAAALDWGNVPRSSSEDRTFRIKNLSSTLTANSVLLSFIAPTDTTPSVAGQHLLSSDGLNFYATRTITTISPGAMSAVYTVRRTTPVDAVLSVWTVLLMAEATAAWT